MTLHSARAAEMRDLLIKHVLTLSLEVSFRSPLNTSMILGSYTTLLSFKHLQNGGDSHFNELL